MTNSLTLGVQLTTVRKIVGKFLTHRQLATLLKAAEQSDNKDMAEIIKVMGATGLRREHALAMRWEWFDSERSTLSVPATADKAKKGFVLHLSSGLLEVLQQRMDESDSEWVFPNPKTGQPYNSCRNAWVTARERAGPPGLCMHDLRHTYASMMLDSGSEANAAASATGLFA